MRARVRSTAAPAGARLSTRLSTRRATRCAVIASAVAPVLVLTGCGGDGKRARTGSTPPIPVPSAPASAPPVSGQPRLPAVPKGKPAEVRALVGRWVSPRGDYFQFRQDGTGSWTKNGQSLWNGQVIPEGKGTFRFSWQGGDPKTASYWGATLTGGSTLLFAGTDQTYTKAKG